MPATALAASSGKTVMQDAQTTGNGRVLNIPSTFKEHTFYVRGDGTIAGGAVTIETADSYNYSGTWIPLVNSNPTPLPNPITVVAGEAMFTYRGPLAAVRARISTNVSGAGGSVTVTYVGGRN